MSHGIQCEWPLFILHHFHLEQRVHYGWQLPHQETEIAGKRELQTCPWRRRVVHVTSVTQLYRQLKQCSIQRKYWRPHGVLLVIWMVFSLPGALPSYLGFALVTYLKRQLIYLFQGSSPEIVKQVEIQNEASYRKMDLRFFSLAFP